MNNNYNNKRRLNDNIYLQLIDKVYDDDSSSSDSAFSDGFDSRLDEDFNEMISQIKKKRKLDEQQLGNTKEEPIETHIEPMENGTAIQKFPIVNVQGNEISITTANESYDADPSIKYESSENPTTVEKISVDCGSICVKQEPIEICQSIENADKTSAVNDIEQIQDTPKSNRFSIADEYDDNTSSSDSVSSDECDSRLDTDFNEMIRNVNMKRRVCEQQLSNVKEGLIETHNPIEIAQPAENLSIVTVHHELSTFPEEIQSTSVVESTATNQSSENGAADQKISIFDVPEEIQGTKNSTSTENDSYVMDLIEDTPSRSLIANESYVVTPIATNQESGNGAAAQKISIVDVPEDLPGNKNSTSTVGINDSYVMDLIEDTPSRSLLAKETYVVTPIAANQESGNAAAAQKISIVDVPEEIQGNKNSTSTVGKNDSYVMDLNEDTPSRSLIPNESYVVTPIATNQVSDNGAAAHGVSVVDVHEEIQGNKNSISTSSDSYVVDTKHTPNLTSIANQSYVAEPIAMDQESGNGAAVYEVFVNDEAIPGNRAYCVPVDVVNNNNQEEVPKNDPITIANESYVLDHQLEDLSMEIEIEEDAQLSILHSTASNSMLANTDLDDSNWTDYESDVTHVTYN